MNCPICGKTITDCARFCMYCGTPLGSVSAEGKSTQRIRGSLSANFPVDNTNSQTNADMEEQSGAEKPSGLKSTVGKRPSVEETTPTPITYCKRCGRKLEAGEKCPVCNAYTASAFTHSADMKSNKNSKAGVWIASIAPVLVLVIATIIILPKKATNPKNDSLSSTCDYILCVGCDTSGNEYELVANQSETSKGFEIAVGIIKNNQWLCSPSSAFPFLAEDGLFHVNVPMGGGSGTPLKHPGENEVIDNLYFIDSGAFLLDCYKSNDSLSLYDHYYIIFSCDTLKSTKIDCANTSLLYRYNEPSFYSGEVTSYGQIYTDNGKLIMYTETSGTNSGWLEDQVFNWDLLDTRTLTTTTIASSVKGVKPKSVLAEGMFFCTDKRFYNTNGQSVVDLSEYAIDIWDHGDICFENGICTFEVNNSLGTRFLISIDASGNVISEEPA